MDTLSELLSRIETAPFTEEKEAPGWKELRKNGGGIVERADFSGDAFIEVFAKGYAYYFNGYRRTTFSMQDTTLSYEFNNQEDNPEHKKRTICKKSPYYECSWVVRTLLEGEFRIVRNQKHSRAEKNKTYYDSTYDDYGLYGSDHDDPLTILMKKEESVMIHKCLCQITARQRQVIEDNILNERKKVDIAKDIGITHQAISDAFFKGCERFKRLYEEIYGDDN